MEKDNEVNGNNNSYTTQFRQYDPRIGRWLSIDPLAATFPWQSPYVGFDNNPVYFNDPKGSSSEGPGDPVKKPTPATNKGDRYAPPGSGGGKQGDMYTFKFNPKVRPKSGGNRASTTYDSEQLVFHEGNDNYASGWYSPEEYEYTELDYENGQVMPALTGWDCIPACTDGARDFHGWGVGVNGYLTKGPVKPEYAYAMGGGITKVGKGLTLLGSASKTKAFYTVYNGLKEASNGKWLLYIGKAKHGIKKRYTLGEIDDYTIQAFKQLQRIPDNGTALGVEQAIMELNGFAGKTKNISKPVLSNVNNATIKQIYKNAGTEWLNSNVKDWEKIFKLK